VLNILLVHEAFHYSFSAYYGTWVPFAINQSELKPCFYFCFAQPRAKSKNMSEWKPIAIAPANVELELSVYDKGEHHALVFPCRRDGSGWRDVRTNRHIQFEPTHWRLWVHD
jgi:hypothetical protein